MTYFYSPKRVLNEDISLHCHFFCIFLSCDGSLSSLHITTANLLLLVQPIFAAAAMGSTKVRAPEPQPQTMSDEGRIGIVGVLALLLVCGGGYYIYYHRRHKRGERLGIFDMLPVGLVAEREN